MRKWNFFKWTRDNQKRFADEVAAELDNKASRETVDNLLAGSVSKTGDTMTGVLTIRLPPGSGRTIYPITLQGQFSDTGSVRTWRIGLTTFGTELYFRCDSTDIIGISNTLGIFPAKRNSGISLGFDGRPWKITYTTMLNNGADIEIPTKGGTMALVSDIEDILRQHGLIPPETTGQTEQQGVQNA